jgi:hypothetical protein
MKQGIHFSNSQTVIARSDLSAVAQRAQAEATKQSMPPREERMDCFRLRSLSYGGQVVARAPRNDEDGVAAYEAVITREGG